MRLRQLRDFEKPSTMDKDDIMKKTKRKNMISIMGMIMNTGFFFILT